ncbi:glycoside hydrolase family 2 protein [Solitalea lacus]|uniref:glycoside hydrolase family 2 protein n=1 Tax=Solitalea lacus TaxID=2911172 RepID=UPI001EDB05B4|nr:glycoside hydrolase family 2 TIM barrel-domain containing protein [Solitalea lacus]UKJ07492.1 DUF4982 domain-containing protein [Solitalea lacus]
MKRFSISIVLLIITQIAFSQTEPRTVLSFNHSWEMFPIEKTTEIKIKNARVGTSFQAQFNQEVVDLKNESQDSIARKEIGDAVKGFADEYSIIKALPWEKVSLPHPVRYEKNLNPAGNQFTGICYYRKQFTVPVNFRNCKLSIQFEGAMQTASIWINGKFVMQHRGGYTPFMIPLNGYIDPNATNEIIVRLDNTDDKNTPPGKPLASLGFLYWSGIYRDTWLIATNPVYITDPVEANTVAGGGVFVRYENVSVNAADILIKTQVKNDGISDHSFVIKQIISNPKEKQQWQVSSERFDIEQGVQKEVEQKITIAKPKLWSPDAPNRYLLITEVWNKGQLVDRLTQRIGIRKLSFSRKEGFKLNDQPLWIVGTNRHQDHPFIGNALSDAAQYRDLKRIKEAGFNFVRLAHYPHDPSVYDICDSLGIMVGNPIPGWQFFNKNKVFTDRVFRDIRDMIRRDRNHPSVIMWEASLNESYPYDEFRIKSAEVAHEEYPGDNFFTCGDTYAAKKTNWDVPFCGWGDPFGRPQNVQPEAPSFVREYGDYEFGGAESTTRVNRSHGEKALLQNAWNFQWEHNLLRGPEYQPWTIGDATWAFFDGFEVFDKNTSDWGVMDVYRLPKFGFYFFRSQLSPTRPSAAAENTPMAYIANWWTSANSADKVVVFSNCDEIALYLNGKLISKQKPDSGKDTPYGDFYKGGNPFDGGNCIHLDHPPFTFNKVNWQPGELKAVGYIKGKKVTSSKVITPSAPNKLSLTADTKGLGLVADGADAIFIHAEIQDVSGSIVLLDNETEVDFTVEGNGVIVSPKIVKVRGGIASILIRSTEQTGPIVIKATAKGLKTAALTITSKTDTRNY